MKKLITVLLAMLMMLCLFGCSGSKEEEGPAEETSDKPKIGFMLTTMDGSMVTTAKNLESEAERLGWDYTTLSSEADTAREMTNAESLVTLGVDVVVILIVDSDASVAAIKYMTDNGVKVIIAGRSANVQDGDYATYVAGDHNLCGEAQAQFLNDYLAANPDKELNIAFVRGSTSSTAATAKYEGFVNGFLKQHENDANVHYLAEDYGEFTAEKAYNLVTDWLQLYPELNVIVSQSDDMTSGIVNAIKTQGLDPVNDFVIISADGTSVGIEGIRSGEFDCSVCMSMKALAEQAMKAAETIRNGGTLNQRTPIEGYYRLMTPENVDQIAAEEGLD